MKRMTIAILSIAAIAWQPYCLAGDSTSPPPQTVSLANQATNRVDITTISGQEFKNCKITQVEPDGITVFYAKGVAKISFTNLPDECRTKYGYDPQKAEDYSRMANEQRAAALAIRTGIQALPGALPNIGEKASGFEWSFNLSQEKFFISVPISYAGHQPFGVFVFISPSDECTAVPPGWGTVLQQKNLIFIAPQNAGNNQPTSRRAGLAVLAASKLLEMAKLDTNRVYAAGFSGGARVASYVSFLRPTLFSGVFAVCGVDFPRKVPRVNATKEDDYGYFSLGEQQMNETKKNVKFVLVTGSKDFRHGNILDIYAGGFRKDDYAVKLIDVPEMDHAICSPNALSQGIVFLDKKTESSPSKK
jgi:hypothetical protein